MANFPNDGVGYNGYTELMNKRGGNRRATTLMLPSYWSAEDIAANAAMGNNAADLCAIQDQEQAAFEASQPKLDASEAQAIELTRYLGNVEADKALSGDEYAVTLDAEMVAALNAERADHARFGCETHCNNLSGDPIARGLTSEEEDAEVGRLWGIDASRTEGGE